MSIQLTLPVRLRDDATFANFYPGKNQSLLTFLLQFAQATHGLTDNYIYLWGHKGAGCSHLLQAMCQLAHEHHQHAIYLPLLELKNLSANILENLENANLICIDDMQSIAGDEKWEEALFNLYNRCKSTGTRLIIAGNTVPLQLNVSLPDLTSRLTSGLIMQVQELDDKDKLAALQLRAKIRGMELSMEVGEYLLKRIPRDGTHIFSALETLDQLSLREQRKLTIPFVKEVLKL